MKEYDAKVLIDGNKVEILYECDKDKNIECCKQSCGECNHTTDIKYAKAKKRVQNFKNNKNITDRDIIDSQENEIEYYRHKLDMLTKAHREDKECIREQDKLIEEYKETLRRIILNEEDIFDFKTPNQIRRLLGFKSINNEQNPLDTDTLFTPMYTVEGFGYGRL